MCLRRMAAFAALVSGGTLPDTARAQYTLFTSGQLAAFNSAAGNPPVAISFDDIAPGTNVGNGHFSGATLYRWDASLIVCRGVDTVTPGGFFDAPNPAANQLFATSGANVLSPGGTQLVPGPLALIEGDAITIQFDSPVAAFAFDHLSQSADGFGFTQIAIFSATNTTLYAGAIPISNLGGGGAPGAADFWGIVFPTAVIDRLNIFENDADNQFPDCNIGFDTLRFHPPAVCVGDVDGDGDVDLTDLATLLTNFGQPSGATLEDGDLDRDADVDLTDLAMLLAQFGTSC
ncbi:MAG: dockerin type I domain-containing protein [Phycisphaerae bacterium]